MNALQDPVTDAPIKTLEPLRPVSWDRDITFFVACYNEEENIAGTLDTLLAAIAEVGCSSEILIIDDGSRDRSVEVIQHYIREHPGTNIYCQPNPENKGLAQCYIDGAFLGRGKYYRLVCGDDVEPKETFVTILKHLGEADMIIPYQLETKGKSFFRRMLSKVFTFLVNMASGYRIRYYNGLAVHTRYNVMRWNGNDTGFSFQANLITRLLDEGHSYIEVPVMARERAKGNSKALTAKNFLAVTRMFFGVLSRRLDRKKKRKK